MVSCFFFSFSLSLLLLFATRVLRGRVEESRREEETERREDLFSLFPFSFFLYYIFFFSFLLTLEMDVVCV